MGKSALSGMRFGGRSFRFNMMLLCQPLELTKIICVASEGESKLSGRLGISGSAAQAESPSANNNQATAKRREDKIMPDIMGSSLRPERTDW